MTSSTTLATNNVDYKPTLLKTNKHTASSETNTANSFSETLKSVFSSSTSNKTKAVDELSTATSDKPAEQVAAAPEVGETVSNVASSAIDLGMGLATGNPLTVGLGGTDMLQTVLRADIEAQFTQLGQGIATALIAGLAGDPSATKVLPTSDELAAQAAAASAEIVSNSSKQVAALNNNATSSSLSINEGKGIPTKGTIPKAILEASASTPAEILKAPEKV
ncbi:hypothetical protein [Agarivorans sp.]|uniref:hypothetical protein n=1 Tax=Agarivorans sp. TaxID=1872412 RepID=UPI003CFD40A8